MGWPDIDRVFGFLNTREIEAMSDQADGLRRLVRSRGEASTPVPAKAEPPPRPKPRPPGLFAAIAVRWVRGGRADYSA
jgi:hypothetical protein